MSRTHDMDCEQVRKQAYRYRRGELIGAETGAIEAHLDDCATCRDYYERLGILLGSASAWEPSDEAGDADELFAGIAARVEAADEDTGQDPGQDREDDEVHEDYEFGRPRWVSGLAGLAAGVLLTLGGFYLFQQLQDAETSGADRASVVADKEDESTPEITAESELEAMTRQESDAAQVEVFASKGADWSLTGDEELVLALEHGTLLVEFVPEDGRTLRVDAPDMSVQVVGTVFYVSADEDGPRAGVLAGEVEVTSGDGKAATVEARREVSADFEVREMSEERQASLARLVDPDEHLAKLAGLELARKDPARKDPARIDPARIDPARVDRPRAGQNKRAENNGKPESSDSGVENAAEPEDAPEEEASRLPPDLERLRARAERATRQGDYHDAVRYYRSLLDRLPPVHPIAASVHLDLAHIYLHRLNSPGRAAPHLRTFVDRWPSDVAAESARRELCKIDDSEPGCGVSK